MFLEGSSSSCVWAALQTKSARSSSHFVLLMSGDRKSSGQFGGLKLSQSKIILLADCSSAPQTHLGVSGMPQRYRHVSKRLTPVLSLFSATHRLRGSSEPDGRQTAGVTKNWAGGLALSHAALHVSRRLKPEFTSVAAWRKDHSRTVGAGVGDESTESFRVVQPLRIPSVIRPKRLTNVIVVFNYNHI